VTISRSDGFRSLPAQGRRVVKDRGPEGPEDPRSYLDALVAHAKTPGLEALVLDSGQIRFEYDGGWADVRGRVPMAAATTLMAYSMSKTITAAAVLQLVEAGAIGLDDPITRYVSQSPYGPLVTVRELLSHTSGIPNPLPLRWVHPAARHETFDESASLAAVLAAHPSLAFQPGTRYAYSNIGYWLLGGIIERASGRGFAAYVTERVLEPLGILPQELGYVIPDAARHAKGYLEKYSLLNLAKGFLIDRELVGGCEGPWTRIESHYVNGPAFGGLVGTVRGFGKFLQDQLRPHSRLFNDETRALFQEPQKTLQGTPVAMTLGWHLGDLDGNRFFYKEGGGGGFHSLMRLYPDAGVATVVMTNATGFAVGKCLDTLGSRFLRSSLQAV
jgi:CubicO group peptidase (beta-lactamase class C family)